MFCLKSLDCAKALEFFKGLLRFYLIKKTFVKFVFMGLFQSC